MTEISEFFTTVESGRQGFTAPSELIHASQNGFCDIYRIDRMGRFRALKCLKPAFRGKPLYEDLLRKEFEIGYSLRHSGIVEYYGFLPVEGLGNCIEMEWVDGRTLADEMEKGPLDKTLEDKVLDELCDALSYLHARQVVHRDLKPSNILLTHTGNNVRLIDFGFSDSDSHSILKSPAGTVNYTAPEVLAGNPADERSDIYSLGLIIYQLSRRYRRVARKCCEKKPFRRYSSMAQVKKALHGHSSLLAGMLLILAVVSATLFPYFQKSFHNESAETPIPADSTLLLPVVTDTLPAVLPKMQEAAPTRPRAQEVRPKEIPVDTTTIDELFRQATDLFD